MIPAEFEYFAPESTRTAAELLARHPGAKLLAGGMSLIPALKHRLLTPPALIDLGRIPGLDGIDAEASPVALGGLATHAELARVSAFAPPHPLAALGETAAAIGDVQVRNRGTIGGSLVHADPAADWPAAFLALDGEAVLTGPSGERTVAASEFFVAMLVSALDPGEILTSVRIPAPAPRSGSAYHKLRQSASGFAVVGVCARVALDAQGRIASAAVGVTGVNPVPFRATALETRLAGAEPKPDALRALCARIDEADPMEDLHASAEYRAHLAGVYAARAVQSAAERAGR